MKFFTTSAGYLNTEDFVYLPLAHGTQAEYSTIIDSHIDETNFIIPYDLKINMAYLNITRGTNSNPQPGHTKIALWKDGEKYSNDVIVNIEGIGYDTFDLHYIFTFDFKNEMNSYKAGEILQMSIHGENRLYYYSMTITGEYLEE